MIRSASRWHCNGKEHEMGEARDVLDRFNEALLRGDFDAVSGFYAEDAVAVTPDQGEITGRDNVTEYVRPFMEAFSDLRYESLFAHESGNCAIDEGYFVGTHTGPLPDEDEPVQPTGRTVRVRECDAVTVDDGRITSHRFYFDQMDFMTQLGLM
jgi:ketosteroid isomerase-like protein